MNLATLWSLERARVCAQPETDVGGDAALGLSLLLPHGGSGDRRALLKRVPSNSSVATKKNPSIVAQRDAVYQKLLAASAVPSAPTTSDTANEFAIEYADRAPRRFVQHATSMADTSHGHADHVVVDSQAKPSKRRKSALAPVGVTAAGPPAVPASVTARTAVSKVAASLVASTSGAHPRRNARKRGNGTGGSLELASHAFKPYVGDMFSTRGDYVEGMLYMSRMKHSHQLTFGRVGSPSEAPLAGRNVLKDAVSDALSAAVAAAAAGNLNVTAGDSAGLGSHKGGTAPASTAASSCGLVSSVALLSDISAEEILQLRQRQQCSRTLSNWSSNPENAWLMVQENVVQALILLCKASGGDRVTKLNCVTSFMNLSHGDDLRSEMVQQGAVKTLVEIANDTEDDKILRTACAVTLCNLCCCIEGEEEILVEDGAVSALSLLINEHPKTASICLGALFNLTCVKEPFHKIESVLKVFLTLASSASSPSAPSGIERDEMIAKAICNLSNFKRVRLRLMEEGVVSALSNLIHPGHSYIQQLLAYVLLNLSAMRACRSELVAKGCIGALVALTDATSSHDGEAKYLIALTLWNLSKEPGNRLRMVFEGLLLLVNELCRGAATDRNSQSVRSVCARTVYNVSCSEETRVKLVERDAVNCLSGLSQRYIGDDGKKMCTLALCNLLSVQQAAADIVTAGAITSLVELSIVMEPPPTLETRHLFSKALYGLCEMGSTRAAVVHAGIIPAIIHLCSISIMPPGTGAVGVRQAGLLSEIRARCTAALACLAGDEAMAPYVCTPDVVRCVIHILVEERFNIAIERFCCSCLSLLCRDEQCSLIVADEGAIQALLTTCLESQDLETKASCCHVLASMSCHRSCCMALVNMGALPVLATLAKTGGPIDSIVQRCCAITLANLSAEKDIRSIITGSSIVPLLSLLSNSYSEESQRDCARVLCNLSCVTGRETALVHEGALGVLMMISMVRALHPTTKETCLRAFANLLTPATTHAMIQEGIVKVLPAFAALAAPLPGDSAFASTVIQVVSVVYCKLLRHSEGRQALRTERAALRALVALRPPRGEDEGIYEHLLSETVHNDELRETSVDAGVVEALHQLALQHISLGHSVARIANLLFTLAQHEATRQAAGSVSSLSTIGAILSSDSCSRTNEKESVEYSVSAVCHLAWDNSTRALINAQEITAPLTRLLRQAVEGCEQAPTRDAVSTCLLTLCCLSDNDDHFRVMLQENILHHLLGLVELESTYSSELLPLMCILARQLSHTPAFVACLVKSPTQTAVAIKLFCSLAKHAVAKGDRNGALDCADLLCSITFLPPTRPDANSSNRSTPFVRRQSQPQVIFRGSMAISSSIPPVPLISSEVLDAIAILVDHSLPQLEETRWRCMAALYAFSCITDYRHNLVRLGCAQLLVRQAAAAVESPSAVELATLRCCAGALCNLTIVYGPKANANAQTMVEQDVVSALIRLAKRDNDEVREYCTLALSNLSTQSPKVEAGAVSALLSMSLHSGGATGVNVNSQVGISRPPLIVNARHKAIASLPRHTLQLASHEELLARKYEAAQGHASKPPPPHIPTISPNLSMVGGQSRSPPASLNEGTACDGSDAAASREEPMMRRRRSSSIGDLMGTSPVTTPALGNNTSRGDGNAAAEGDLRGWPTIVFPKIDPVESRAMTMNMDDGTDPADGDDESTSVPTTDSMASTEEALKADSGSGDDLRDTRSESEESQAAKSKPGSAGGLTSLSPLARVVIRKSQTSHAVDKLKKLRSGGLHGGSHNRMTPSTTAMSLATVDEAPEPGPLSHGVSSRNLTSSQTPISKTLTLHRLGTPKTLVSDAAAEPHVGTSTVSGQQDLLVESDELSPSPLAAAAAVALLYSSGPDATSSKPSGARIKPNAKLKSKVTAKPKQVDKHGEYLSSPFVPVVTKIEDVQAQVKLLGLWS